MSTPKSSRTKVHRSPFPLGKPAMRIGSTGNFSSNGTINKGWCILLPPSIFSHATSACSLRPQMRCKS